MLRRTLLSIALALACGAAVTFARTQAVLPSGWRLTAPQGPLATTGTMPQGIALSPDGSTLAVVESGTRPAALRLFEAKNLREITSMPLKGAFGAPIWTDSKHVLIAGANADAVLNVDTGAGTVAQVPTGKQTWPAAVAVHGDTIATANDGDGTATIGSNATPVGEHPSALVFSRDGKTVYVAVRQTNVVRAIDSDTHSVRTSIAVGLHPGALALSEDGTRLYVAENDDDNVAVIDTKTNAVIAQIPVGLHASRASGYGASPNALLVHGGDLWVTLGAQNAVALIRNGRVVERIPAGWYPTGIAVSQDGTLYVVNGKGEGAPPNPQFQPFAKTRTGYVADNTIGSVRAIPAQAYADVHAETAAVSSDAAPQWTAPPDTATVVRPNGPIRHVIYVIKENRSYDQVLGDVAGANGDPALVRFGETITPNQHAIARRFGVFDNAYANSQVSADGHNWTDAAFADDYVERFWPPTYGDRRSIYDLQSSDSPASPHNGYIWDAAKRAHITYRDYGEDVDVPPHAVVPMSINTFPGLTGHFDPRYIGWNLAYSDDARYAEWRREFQQFAASGTLPQLEIVYMPNDHTSGTKAGAPTPEAYVAQNDWAVGRIVDTVSHSRYWKSTAIFVIEDDAQNGPDHVSDQRSTFYVASAYARGGVVHAHYATTSVLHTIELILGIQPLSIYDATARPMYDAFAAHAINAAAYAAVKPAVDMNALNAKTAYGAAISAKLDFSKPDAADPRIMRDVLAHSVRR